MLTISKYFIKINVQIITTLKNIIIKIISIILYPIKKITQFIRKYILKFILKPFKILTINIKNIVNPKKINQKKNNPGNETNKVSKIIKKKNRISRKNRSIAKKKRKEKEIHSEIPT